MSKDRQAVKQSLLTKLQKKVEARIKKHGLHSGIVKCKLCGMRVMSISSGQITHVGFFAPTWVDHKPRI